MFTVKAGYSNDIEIRSSAERVREFFLDITNFAELMPGVMQVHTDAKGVAQGVFVTGWQPVYSDPGPDNVIGTADDAGAIVANLQRRVVITDVCDPDRPSPTICSPAGTYKVKIRSVAVTVQYYVGGLQRQENLTTVLTDYSIPN